MRLSPDLLPADFVRPTGIVAFDVIRHGRCYLNTVSDIVDGVKMYGVQGGGTNNSLDEIGIQQGLEAGEIYREMDHIRKIGCSSQARAVQTAILLTFKTSYRPTEYDDNLKEHDFGKHEGGLGPREMFEEDYDGTELFKEFILRVAKALETHCRTPGTLLVAHAGVVDVIALILGVRLCEEQYKHCAINHFEPDGANWTATIRQKNLADLDA